MTISKRRRRMMHTLRIRCSSHLRACSLKLNRKHSSNHQQQLELVEEEPINSNRTILSTSYKTTSIRLKKYFKQHQMLKISTNQEQEQNQMMKQKLSPRDISIRALSFQQLRNLRLTQVIIQVPKSKSNLALIQENQKRLSNRDFQAS